MAQNEPSAWESLPAPDSDDPLDANAWAHRALVVSMYEVVGELRDLQRQLDECDASAFGGDDEVDKLERTRLARRAELREIAASMRALIPQARLRDAEAAVHGEEDDLAAATRGPVTVDAQSFPGSGGRPKAKRGRPSKRSLL